MFTAEECYRISQAVYQGNFARIAPWLGDDLVQEGAIGIWKGQGAYRAGLASERTFASRLARNAMIDALRRLIRPRGHETPADDFTLLDEPAIEDDLTLPEASETWLRVEADVEGDTRRSRWRAIVAGRVSGLADTEIARMLGISKASLSREASKLASHAASALGLTGPSTAAVQISAGRQPTNSAT